jgi:hypothetical protein
MCWTQLCTKTQHNMCRTQLYTENTTHHVSDTSIHQKHNTTCVGHNYAQKNTTQHVSDTTMHKKTQ